MPEYRSPGVYVEEIPQHRQAIVGVGTSTLGVVGECERGPEDVRAVNDYAEFRRLYGDPLKERYVAHAVRGFFENGGLKCFVARVTGPDARTAMCSLGPLAITAIGPGMAGEDIWVWIRAAGSGRPDRFSVVVAYFCNGVRSAAPLDPTVADNWSLPGYDKPTELETFDDLAFAEPEADATIAALNGSSLVRAAWTGPPGRPTEGGPYRLDGASAGGTPTLEDFQGHGAVIRGLPAKVPTGLEGLARIEEIGLVAAPDEHEFPGVRERLVEHCTTLGNRFGIVAAAPDSRDVTAIAEPQPPSSFAAVYWPWIRIRHPVTGEPVDVTPVGHVAGVFARTDATRGVHKAPANEVVRGAADLEFTVTADDQNLLNPRGINVIRDFRASNRGIRLWGARTMSSDPEWKYVNVRRLFIFLEQSIDRGTQWTVFEPNAAPLWSAVKSAIENFLVTVWRDGALQGATPEESFFVKCDRTTMTQQDIDSGRLVCQIGIAPVKPAEFVIFRLVKKTRSLR